MKNLLLKISALLLVLSLTGCGYNTFQSLDEEAKASWAEVLNQYQRRADLVPNLVNVVKGYAAHEEKVLTEVADARARVGSIQADQGFRDLQAQLEGTENRITVARNRYIETIKNYNVAVRSFPQNLTAMMFDYKTKPSFTVDNEKAISVAPAVSFEDKK